MLSIFRPKSKFEERNLPAPAVKLRYQNHLKNLLTTVNAVTVERQKYVKADQLEEQRIKKLEKERKQSGMYQVDVS